MQRITDAKVLDALMGTWDRIEMAPEIWIVSDNQLRPAALCCVYTDGRYEALIEGNDDIVELKLSETMVFEMPMPLVS